MKKTVFLLLSLLLFSCATTKKFPAVKNNKGDLIGVATKNSFKQEPYASKWFNKNYKNYQTRKEKIQQLKAKLKHIKIKGFMGTWCEDSQREIPPFYKILDEANFNLKNLELITVNRKKKAKGLEKRAHLTHVPTFIFYKNGKELGRFVEHPNNNATIEGHILKIVSAMPYKHSYQK